MIISITYATRRRPKNLEKFVRRCVKQLQAQVHELTFARVAVAVHDLVHVRVLRRVERREVRAAIEGLARARVDPV